MSYDRVIRQLLAEYVERIQGGEKLRPDMFLKSLSPKIAKRLRPVLVAALAMETSSRRVQKIESLDKEIEELLALKPGETTQMQPEDEPTDLESVAVRPEPRLSFTMWDSLDSGEAAQREERYRLIVPPKRHSKPKSQAKAKKPVHKRR